MIFKLLEGKEEGGVNARKSDKNRIKFNCVHKTQTKGGKLLKIRLHNNRRAERNFSAFVLNDSLIHFHSEQLIIVEFAALAPIGQIKRVLHSEKKRKGNWSNYPDSKLAPRDKWCRLNSNQECGGRACIIVSLKKLQFN